MAAIFAERLAPEATDDRPDDERRVPRGLARARARRRLHGLVRARDRARGRADHRHPGRAADGRLRRRPGADRRVRRPTARSDDVVGPRLREVAIPPDSKVASIIRGDRMIVPRGDETIEPGDRVIIIGSPEAPASGAGSWPAAGRAIDDVVIFGGGRTGAAVAGILIDEGSACASSRRTRSGPARSPRSSRRARLPRDRDRPRLPRAGADRPGAGAAVFAMPRRREEPLRGHAGEAPRRPVHDRGRPRPGLRGGLRARRDRRRRSTRGR